MWCIARLVAMFQEAQDGGSDGEQDAVEDDSPQLDVSRPGSWRRSFQSRNHSDGKLQFQKHKVCHTLQVVIAAENFLAAVSTSQN